MNLQVPKDTGSAIYSPNSADIDNAMLAGRAMRTMLRHGDMGRLDVAERKSLSSFSFGNSG
jgi:hypothetical protein